jgi:crossover junction endodeoxyribonuclease RuvC
MILTKKECAGIILGVDPGLRQTGYGILKKIDGAPHALDYGVIKLPENMSLPHRLCAIHEALRELILRHSVETIATETQFVARNISSTIKLGMVRGVTLALAGLLDLNVVEYAPTRIKKAATGKGLATKAQIQFMMMTRLKLENVPPEDAADALAMALCHLNHTSSYSNITNPKGSYDSQS